jgi:hypothetical protein
MTIVSKTDPDLLRDKAYELGLARIDRPKNLKKSILEYMYDPRY